MGVFLELGRVPLSLYAVKLAIKNWEIIRSNKADYILMESYKESEIKQLPWIFGKKTLELNGMLNFYLKTPEDGKSYFINKRAFQLLNFWIFINKRAFQLLNVWLSEYKNGLIRLQPLVNITNNVDFGN